MRRAKQAIAKRRLFVSREPLFIREELVKRLLERARLDDDMVEGMLYLAAYIFLLRVPSEALPMCRESGGMAAHGQAGNSCIRRVGDEVVLNLRTRKNRRQGSTLTRRCWCSKSVETCPLHVLWPFFEGLPEGSQPFRALRMESVLMRLRLRLRALNVENANDYRTHDFRRGHARDLQASGASLLEILQAGEWRSPAFLRYLDNKELEKDVVIQAHFAESSGSEEER